MFGHILKTIKGIFSRKVQAGAAKKYTEKEIPNPKMDRFTPKGHYRPRREFEKHHGRKEARCRWWAEIGKGYVIGYKQGPNKGWPKRRFRAIFWARPTP